MSNLLNLKQTAELLNLKERTIYQYASRKRIPGRVRICGKILFDKDVLANWIKQHTEEN